MKNLNVFTKTLLYFIFISAIVSCSDDDTMNNGGNLIEESSPIS